MQYADVAVATRGSGPSLLTYSIPPQLLPEMFPGVVVDVPYRKKFVTGVIVGLRRSVSDRRILPKLRPIHRVLSDGPFFTPTELRLRAHATKESFGLHEGLWYTLGLPPRSLFAKLQPAPAPLPQAKKSRNVFLVESSTPATLDKLVRVMRKILERGCSVVMILPTQELLGHWHDYLKKTHPDLPVFAATDDQNVAESLPLWECVVGMRAALILGHRSASLLPLRKLGLVIVIQPNHHQLHEEQAPYYDAFELSLLRSRAFGVSMIAVDVLPPLDLLKKPLQTQWQFRLHSQKPPNIRIIHAGRRPGMTESSLAAIGQTLAADKQALVIVPQKGWAAGYVCKDCGHIFRCPEHATVLAADRDLLTCPLCPYTTAVPQQCAVCRGTNLTSFGWRSERWRDELTARFPTANVVMQTELTQNPRIRADIILAHPAWGHLSVPAADLVIAISPEESLSTASFAATEIWLHLLWTLRAHAERELILETETPDHPAFQELPTAFPRQSLKEELQMRRRHGYPPFGQLYRLTCRKLTASNLNTYFAHLKTFLETHGGRIIGPKAISGRAQDWTMLLLLPERTTVAATQLRKLLPPRSQLERLRPFS